MRAEPAAGDEQSLRLKLLRRVFPPVVVAIVLSALIAYAMALRFANVAYDHGLYDQARSLGEQVQFAPDGRALLELSPALEKMVLSDPFDRIYYRVLLAGGRSIAGRGDLPAPETGPTPQEPVRYYDSMVDGRAVRAAAYSLFDERGTVRATAVVAETLVKRKRLSDRVLFTVLLPLLTTSLLIAVLVWWAIGRGLEPLQRVAATVSQRGWDDLRPIGGQGVPQEARPLTRAIDDLMQRLGEAHAAQQRFIVDAAHQLRTPLAGLSAQAQRALAAGDMATIKAALAQLEIAAQRLTRLVNQLLTLASAEPSAAPARQFRDLDLAALARRVCAAWFADSRRKGVDLGYAGETGAVSIHGDEALLEEMLNNLIDNALRYGPPAGGRVTVRVERAPVTALCVEDDGPALPGTERARIFERFYRATGAAPGGSGLGLAIVREIALAHGAQADVQPGPGGRGNVFSVRFGAATRAA